MGAQRLTSSPLAKAAWYGALAIASALLIARWMGALREVGAARRKSCIALDPQPVDQPAAQFVLPGLDGKKVSLASLRGRVVLLHFWFTRCPPCVAELPSLATLREALRVEDFALVTVAVDEAADVKRFLEQHRLADLPVLLDPQRRVPASYGTEKFPETYLIDRQGRARYRFVNKRDWSTDEARACVTSLM